jgi:hypothetical protein
VELSTATPVSSETLTKLLEEWWEQFRRDFKGSAILLGIHTDTERVHAHALIFVPRRFSSPFLPPGVFVVREAWAAWLGTSWRHGRVWAKEYDVSLPPEMKSNSPHGAAEYLARDPGTVVQYGTAPLARLSNVVYTGETKMERCK